ncbi:hypothetical protein PIROE2DRAFT_13544, partial [Piromyces sp. E2]
MLTFIQMLISRIELESESASSFQNSSDTALIDKKTLSIIKLFIYNRSLNQLNDNDYEIYGSYSYVKKTQQVYLAMFNLRLIQLLTFIPRDMFFLTHFQILYNIYAKAILLLIPITYLETADYNFFMSEEEMIYYLREDEEDKKQQEINQMKFEEEMQQEVDKYNKSKNQNEKKKIIKESILSSNKYTKSLGEILKKKISPILRNTSKYSRLFMTSMDIHGRAVELRYYLNNSIMHVFEAEEIYDSMNRLLAEKDLIVKGKKVFFNTVEVFLHEVKEDFNAPLQKTNSMNTVNSTTSSISLAGLSSTDPKTNLANMEKTISTSQLSNEQSKQRKRGLRHRHSMRSLRSTSQYDFSPAKQRSANISKASLLSAASSSLFSNPMNGVEELPPAPSNKNNNPTLNNNKSMRKTTSSLFDQSILNDQRLLNNIYSINETIMSTPKVQKVMAKRERRLSETKEAKTKEKESRFKKEMEKIRKINRGETEDEDEDENGNLFGNKEDKKQENSENLDNNNGTNKQENKENTTMNKNNNTEKIIIIENKNNDNIEDNKEENNKEE